MHRVGELVSAGCEVVVHEATPLHGFGLAEDEDLHSRVTLQVDAGHMYLRRQERCARSDAPLPPWETDPEAGIVLPREALANLALGTVWMDPTGLVDVRRTWVLDTLRAEGWDVVEEGEGNG